MKQGGFWWQGRWYEQVGLLPDHERAALPETVPDDEIGQHPILCPCDPCARYPVEVRRRVKRRHRRSLIPVL